MNKKTLTIGYLTDEIDGNYQKTIWHGVENAVEVHGLNLINYIGGMLEDPKDFPHNVVYDLVDTNALDGLILLSASVRGQLPLERLTSFLKAFGDIPIVSIGFSIPDAPNIHTILVDNKTGLEQGLTHMIEDHGYRRIAFISGPEYHEQAQERYQVYTQQLAKYDIPFNPDLVTHGFFDDASGKQAVKLFLDKRHVEFDAIVAANDFMAIGAIRELTQRGIRVPQDIGVMGFDDASRAKSFSPPLTTVRQAIYAQGYQAVEALLAMINGEAIGQETLMPTELVTRKSCGCFSQAALEAYIPLDKPQHVSTPENKLEHILRQHQDKILMEMVDAVPLQIVGRIPGWEVKLFEAILSDLSIGSGEEVAQGAFITTLDDILTSTTIVDGNDNAAEWQKLISTMRRLIAPFLYSQTAAVHSENIWGQARVVIGETLGRMQLGREDKATERAQVLRDIGTTFMATFSLEHIKNVLINELPELNIPACYLSLCEDASSPTGNLRMLAAYNKQGAIDFDNQKTVFPAHKLVPEGLLPTDRRFVMVVQSLHFENDHLGYVIFEKEHQEGIVYDTLRAQISSSLKGALLVEQEEKRIHQLKTVGEVSSVTSTILDQKELLQEVVNLTKERFGLYHAQIYMLNEQRDTLYLAAGAGDVGQLMMAEAWHIPVTAKHSLIADAVQTGNFIITDNVHEQAGWLTNPFLPDTASEMAVPIISKGEVIGVLDVQSDEIGGLEESDANLLLSLARSVAISLTNANLFSQTVRSKEEAEQAKIMAERIQQEAEAAREEAEAAKQMMEVQVWQTRGLAELNDKVRGEQDIATLADNIVEQICEYLDAQIGALYVAEGDSLVLTGSYAYSSMNGNGRFRWGEGLVGHAAKKNKSQLISDIPADYISIQSGLGKTKPRHIIIVPFSYENRVEGVLEIGTLNQFDPIQLAFLDTAIENIGIVFNTAQARSRINQLLAQTQKQAEELQAQGEELRVANHELAAQTESLRASEAQLKEKQLQLESTNTQLEEKAQALEESSKALREKQQVLDQQNHELKEAQQELEQKAEELALASKYKSEFLANMSHELRTPLNSLLILARLLADNKQGNLTEEQIESAEIIYGGGNDLLNLINDILDLSKIESGKMEFYVEPLPLPSLVSQVRKQFTHVAEEKGLALNITLAEDAPTHIETDQQRVLQIIKNLLSNAFKFTSNGRIDLTIYRPGHNPDLLRNEMDPNQTIAIGVADTGIGMAPEKLKIIFEAFQQADGSTSRQYGGTGLGLSISRELTARLGGMIGVESEQGKGSTFTLYLPITRPAAANGRETAVIMPKTAKLTPSAPPKPQTTPPEPLPPAIITDDRESIAEGSKVLLIIEDDTKFAKIVYNIAGEKGFKCLTASNGHSGLALVQQYKPHAIILDLNLPDISGWQILEKLKNDPATRHIPVHIISVEEEMLDAFHKGAMGYLTKPVSPKNLDQTFANIESFISREIKSLLLVEDDENARNSIMKLLGGSDVQIIEADRGQTALKLLQERPFDCIILDLSLPDMTGFEILNKMNGHNTAVRCPIIVYTGRELTPDENMQLMQYADSIIVKGVKSPERLLDETALFLHRIVSHMPQEKQKTIKRLYDQDEMLKGKHILIVDDDMRNSFALSKLLAEKGIKVRIAANGQKALESLAEEPADLVLMDIMMPVMDGYETTRHIRKQPQFASLPVLALTAKAMKGDREKCIEAGANDYLPKPIDIERLLSMLRVWLYQ